MTDLESRILRLERSASRWRTATLSLLFLTAGTLLMGQIRMGGPNGGINAPLITTTKLVTQELYVDKITTTGSFTLNDAQGKARLVIAGEKDGPSLLVKNADDHALFSISSDGKAASILIQDANGKKLFSAPQ